jgi:hypothetical protein
MGVTKEGEAISLPFGHLLLELVSVKHYSAGRAKQDRRNHHTKSVCRKSRPTCRRPAFAFVKTRVFTRWLTNPGDWLLSTKDNIFYERCTCFVAFQGSKNMRSRCKQAFYVHQLVVDAVVFSCKIPLDLVVMLWNVQYRRPGKGILIGSDIPAKRQLSVQNSNNIEAPKMDKTRWRW